MRRQDELPVAGVYVDYSRARREYEGNRRCSHKGCPARVRRDPGMPWECASHDAALWESPELAAMHADKNEDRADADRAALQTHGEPLTAEAVERLARHWRQAA